MSTLAGTGSLVRMILRRDRVRLPIWVVSLVGVTWASARAVSSTYAGPEQIASYATTMGSSPATVAMSGPPVRLDTIQGIVWNETAMTVLVGTALMAVFLVVRHTRAEEEVGRTELVASTVVGRHAQTAAAVIVALAASVLVGLGVVLAVLPVDFTLESALLYGAAVAAHGLVFAGVAAVAAQLFAHARSANGTSAAVLGLAFALRALGDARDSWLVWLSPTGWSQHVRTDAGDRWWPLLLSLALAGGLLVLAGWLTTQRDIGSGVVAARPGPAHAASLLSSPLGLAWRLQRGQVLGWAIGLFLLGGVFGSVTQEIQDMVRDNPTLSDYFERTGGSITDAFFATALLFMGLGAAGFAVTSALRLHAEEGAGRLEPVLATSVSRTQALLAPLVVTVGGAVVLVSAGGLGVGLADAAVTGEASAVPRLIALSWVQLPAVLVLASLAVLLTGLAPRLVAVAWALLGFCVVLGWLGGLLDLPSWVAAVSPFDHLPAVPVESVEVAPLGVLLLLAAVLTAGGALAFRRRDVH